MARRREQQHLPRLSIAPNLAMQQPGQPLMTPGLPTSLQQSFHPPPFFGGHHRPQQSMQFVPALGHYSRPSMVFTGQPQPTTGPIPGRNRRQLSVGGPPKAVLGGPARKVSPLPPGATPAQQPAPVKQKKLIVNLPKEEESARVSLPLAPMPDVAPPVIISAQMYPSDEDRLALPSTVDVYLPGKTAWDALKKMEIEQKLEQLGVEPGNAPFIQAPHARAASISSPADPALLLFKLNKLHQAQEATTPSSTLTLSPQPPFGLSPRRHGHSMSLAQPPSYQPSLFSSSPNLFGSEYSGDGGDQFDVQPAGIHAPQGRMPTTHVDFVRGFGLDVPLESEEEEEQEEEGDKEQDMDIDDPLPDDSTTAPGTRIHSRRVSRLSDTLSDKENQPPAASDDPAAEWTGSEDLYLGAEETSDDERSLGEFSNPSDEERARLERSNRRQQRRRRRLEEPVIDQPRRIPDFPQPPKVLRREDDIISNPSEDEMYSHRAEFMGVSTEYYTPPINHHHSRVPSAARFDHHTAAAVAASHSRSGSGSYHGQHHSQSSIGRREALNPFAKPFVFPPRPSSGSIGVASGPSTPGSGQLSHARLPSIGKALNVAAPEFKPGNFSFRLPGAPQMPNVPPPVSAPAPVPVSLGPPAAEAEPSPFKTQGREKRQKRGSTASLEDGEGFHSFRFPAAAPVSPTMRRSGSLNDAPLPSKVDDEKEEEENTPFTFDSFSAVAANMPAVRHEEEGQEQQQQQQKADEEPQEEETAKEEGSADDTEKSIVSLPVSSKPKRAPLPLDFKHPSNTVPAGLFKALANGNGDDRGRRATARQRLSSREVFEHMHRPSMDDLTVASIAHSGPRSGKRAGVESPVDVKREDAHDDDDVFGGVKHVRRRSSLPEALVDQEALEDVASYLESERDEDGDDEEEEEEEDLPRREVVSPLGTLELERVIAQVLDDKLEPIFAELSKRHLHDPVVEQKLSDIQSLFRTQLQESAERDIERAHLAARGSMDVAMLRDMVEQGQSQMLVRLQAELARVVDRVVGGTKEGVVPMVESVGRRFMEVVGEVAARQDVGREVVDEILGVLTPLVHSLRSEPIDYDFLTRELTQAVKPHISQLIDLASDKRETAGMIVDQLLPALLPAISKSSSPPVDVNAMTMQLVTEVRRAIAPIDAHEIKEQVSELVVERLDSRLAVRDKTLSPEVFSGKVKESLIPLRESVDVLSERQGVVAEKQERIMERLDTLGELKSGQEDILKKLEQVASAPPPTPATATSHGDVALLKDTVEILSDGQLKLIDLTSELLDQNRANWPKVDELPDAMADMMHNLQNTLAELITAQNVLRRELDEERKYSSELQVQVSKARGSHGQVRVEKDALSEKLAMVEADRDRVRGEAKELEKKLEGEQEKVRSLEAGKGDLRVELEKTNVRLQTTESSVEEMKKRCEALEAEKALLSGKVESLTVDLAVVRQEKEALRLQSEGDSLAGPTKDEWMVTLLNETNEKLNNVFGLLEHTDKTEVHELRDRVKQLEVDQGALQKQLREAETKAATSDRAAVAVRQTLTQAQQRSVEWEKRAKEYEGELELVKTRLDHAEQTHGQLDADYSLVKIQLDEREADARLTLDRENKLRDQAKALEAKCTLLQSELEKARARPAASSAAQVPASSVNVKPKPYTNGNSHPPPRPDSRASTIDGKVDPSGRLMPYSTTQRGSVAVTNPSASVWDSMHAPSPNGSVNGSMMPRGYGAPPPGRYGSYPSYHHQYPQHATNGPLTPMTPKGRRSTGYPQTQITSSYQNQTKRAPSPTPSAVSAAPTQGDDGWWS